MTAYASRRSLLRAAGAAALIGAVPRSLLAADADNKPAVFFIGDSIIRNGTADNGSTNGQWGWGHMMQWVFDTSRIHVVNDAMGGTSSRSYMQSPTLWPLVKQMIRPGDFVLIGFGHNDGPSVLKGNGDETGFIAGPVRRGPPRPPAAEGAAPTPPAAPPPPPAQVEVHSFGWYIRDYIRQIRELGATPIVMSLIPRNRWTDGKIGADGSDFAVWAEQAAKQAGAPFIPLNTVVTARFNEIGQEKVTAELFPEREAVHPNWTGAGIIANLVAGEIRKLDTPLKNYLLPASQIPATPDIIPPAMGFRGPAEMAPKTRTPTPAS